MSALGAVDAARVALSVASGAAMEREWLSMCRVCLQSGASASEYVSLFDCDENNELLRDKYLYCSNIEVSETEPLPSNICLTCVDRLLSAYQFKQQCLASYETLKECFTEFQKTVDYDAAIESVAIKQEDGLYIHYDIPTDKDGKEWQKVLWSDKKKDGPQRRVRGRPRKYPNIHGYIEPSPYRKKSKQNNDDPNELYISTLNEVTGEQIVSKHSSGTEEAVDDDVNDPDYMPDEKTHGQDGIIELALDGSQTQFLQILKKSDDKDKRKRNKNMPSFDIIKVENVIKEEEEDVLMKETMLANSEPIPVSLLSSQAKKKERCKRVYKYDRIHTCEQCGSSFRSNASLQAHIRRHLGIKPYMCSYCDYSCVLNMELRRHMMRHTGDKPYKCRYCDRLFADFGSRQKHERLHLGERPFQCTLCGKSFTYSYVLSNHMLTHTGEKKYACGPCNKRFTKSHHLKYHNKIHHKEIYLKEQLELQKKRNQHIKISDLTTVCTEQLLGLAQDIQGNNIIQVDGMNHTIELPEPGKNITMIDSEHIPENIKILKEGGQIIHYTTDVDIKNEQMDVTDELL